jgi:long-chain fatty acid transport protein
VAPKIKALSVLAATLVFVSTAFASGYQLNEHGARATAMGGAFVARANDPSAIFFNPAGLSYLKGLNVMVGGTLILPSTTFTGPYPNNTETRMNNLVFFPPNAYVTYTMENGLAFGIGTYTPYGLGTDWPGNWVGKFIITKINLQSFYINPTISYSYEDFLSVGIGFDYALGSVELDRVVSTPFSDPTGNPIQPTANLKGNAKGSTFNFGILLTPVKNLSLGFSYRGKVNLKADNGTATFTNAGKLSPLLPGGSVSTSVPLPETWFVGVAYKDGSYSIEADYQYVGWSAFNQLVINFATQTALQSQTVVAGNYSNSYIIRVGGDYRINETITARAGLFYDRNPVPDAYLEPLLPDADRLGINVGAGINLTDNIALDLSYMFLPFKQRTVTTSAVGFNGTYNSTANLIGADLSFKF